MLSIVNQASTLASATTAPLVALSACVAIVSFMAAFGLLRRAQEPGGRARQSRWLWLAAFTSGLGIWTTHFVVALTLTAALHVFHLMASSLLSLGTATVSSLLAFAVLVQADRPWRLLAAAATFTAGIWLAQYVGLDAMAVKTMDYPPGDEALLVVFQFIGVYLSLRLFLHAEHHPGGTSIAWRLLTALPMSLAVVATEATNDHLTVNMSVAVILIVAGYAAAGMGLLIARENRHTAEQQARSLSERRYDALFSAHPDFIAVHNQAGLILDVNQAAKKLLDRETHGLRGKRLSDFLLPDDAVRSERMFANLVHTGNSTEYDACARRSDGKLVILHVTHVPVVLGSQVSGAFSICTDVTRRRRLEQELIATRRHFHVLEKNISDLILITDIHGVIRYASPSHEQLLGLSAKECIRSPITALVHPADKDIVKDALHRMANDPSPMQVDLRFRKGCVKEESEVKWLSLEVRFGSALDAGGHVTEFVMVARDLTDRKKAEEMMLQAEKLSLVGQLAAGLAHEVRNPLTSIKGFLQLLFEQNQDKSHYFGIVFSELQRIEDIMSEFLVMSKPHLKAFQTGDICAITLETAALMSAEAHLRNVELLTSVPPNPAHIWCDAGKLKQVLINLAKNAMDAMPGGGALRLDVDLRADDRVEIRVSDTGVGIPEDQLARLGTPFFTTKQAGTGLGLTVSQKIVQDHGGELTIQSTVGAGTVVTVILPLGHLALK